MRTFALSDIHGDHEAFQRALKHIRLELTDKLLLLGDYIDRGNDSKGVLDTIFSLKENGFDVICLKGNHEQMFLDALKDRLQSNNWLLNGGKETLRSFHAVSIQQIPSVYIDFIESLTDHYEYRNFIFVHAALNTKIENPFEDQYSILWARDQYKLLNKEWLGNRIIVHGHNPTSKKTILQSLNDPVICIDNGSFLKIDGYGNICALQLDDLSVNFY